MPTMAVSPDTTTQTDWAATLSKLATPLVSVYQQKQIADINAQRARQGLPPIDDSGMSAKVGLDADTKKLLMYGIGGLVGVGLLFALRRR